MLGLFTLAAIIANCSGVPWCKRLSRAVIAIPASGMFESNPPKPIGKSRSGSKPRAIASQRSNRLTAIITACPHSICIMPIPWKSAIMLSIFCPFSCRNMCFLCRGVLHTPFHIIRNIRVCATRSYNNIKQCSSLLVQPPQSRLA